MFNPNKLLNMASDAVTTQACQFNTIRDRLDTIIDLLYKQISLQDENNIDKENTSMATIQEVQAAVAAQSTVEDSVTTLLAGVRQQLADAKASGDPAALDAVIANINANTDKLSNAVTANTPVATSAPTA